MQDRAGLTYLITRFQLLNKLLVAGVRVEQLLFAIVKKYLYIERREYTDQHLMAVLTTNFLSESPSALLILIQIIK